jgi:23S rRNA (cytidine1920-2'-O)/16S rRNA (cytidine1409-2'-O)-methyltransferase
MPHPGHCVSRGGDKLAFALDHFRVECSGRICADLGSNVGGFVDCLLQRGAAKVYAIDTGYGVLAWKLRTDDRVEVMERTNALHVRLPEPVSLVTIDVAWTRQHLILPHAIGLLGHPGDVLTLVKPHYESPPDRLRSGVLPDDRLEETLADVVRRVQDVGLCLGGLAECPLRGAAGNHEFWGRVHAGL